MSAHHRLCPPAIVISEEEKVFVRFLLYEKMHTIHTLLSKECLCLRDSLILMKRGGGGGRRRRRRRSSSVHGCCLFLSFDHPIQNDPSPPPLKLLAASLPLLPLLPSFAPMPTRSPSKKVESPITTSSFIPTLIVYLKILSFSTFFSICMVDVVLLTIVFSCSLLIHVLAMCSRGITSLPHVFVMVMDCLLAVSFIRCSLKVSFQICLPMLLSSPHSTLHCHHVCLHHWMKVNSSIYNGWIYLLRLFLFIYICVCVCVCVYARVCACMLMQSFSMVAPSCTRNSEIPVTLWLFTKRL